MKKSQNSPTSSTRWKPTSRQTGREVKGRKDLAANDANYAKWAHQRILDAHIWRNSRHSRLSLSFPLHVLPHPVRCKLDPVFNRRMAVEDEFDDLVRALVRQIQVRQFFHARNKGQRISGYIQRVEIRGSFQPPGQIIYARQDKERQNRHEKCEQRKVGNVRKAAKTPCRGKRRKKTMGGIKGNDCKDRLKCDALPDVVLHVVA